MTKTVFGDLRRDANAVYRVKTQSSTYIIGVHEDDAHGTEAGPARRYVVVRGEPGSDRENVVLRDTDPRVGDWSLFDLPHTAWPGQVLQIATMTSSAIVEATLETDHAVVALVSRDSVRPTGWAPPPPAGMSETPGIALIGGRGTHPGAGLENMSKVANKPLEIPPGQNLARDVVVAAHRPELPYPQRHVRHAEDAAALLRSIARRDRIFEDAAFHKDRDLLTRLRKALAECQKLVDQIRKRDSG